MPLISAKPGGFSLQDGLVAGAANVASTSIIGGMVGNNNPVSAVAKGLVAYGAPKVLGENDLVKAASVGVAVDAFSDGFNWLAGMVFGGNSPLGGGSSGARVTPGVMV